MVESNQLIDDAVRARFPGLSDDKIREFYEEAEEQNSQEIEIKVFKDTLVYARVLKAFGYQGLKDFLGFDLAQNDFLEITKAVEYLNEIDLSRRDNIVMLSSAETSSRKLAKSRQQVSKTLNEMLDHYKVEEL